MDSSDLREARSFARKTIRKRIKDKTAEIAAEEDEFVDDLGEFKEEREKLPLFFFALLIAFLLLILFNFI